MRTVRSGEYLHRCSFRPHGREKLKKLKIESLAMSVGSG